MPRFALMSDDFPRAMGDEDFFRQLADGVPVLIWMSGLDMGCFYFNRAWLDFRGRTLQEEQGNGWAEGVHPEDVQRCVQHYVGCFEARVAFAMSYRLRHHSGEYRWILDRGVPHFTPEGKFLGFYGGCAETVATASVERISQLRSSISEMRELAQRLAAAEERKLLSFQSEARAGGTLAAIARDRELEYRRRLTGHRGAARQIEQLASDMLEHEQIGHGECRR